jgi:hypothetical protein
MPHFFITKYCLSRGIFEIEAVVTSHDKRIIMQTVDGKGINCYYHAREWWEDKDQALKQARKMRNRKVERLRKQIEELNKMRF